MGVILFGINPFLAFVQRFVPRVLFGFLCGYIFRGMRRVTSVYVSSAVTGFFAAFLNTAFFMLALVLLFGNTEYVRDLIGGRNILLFIVSFVGVNAAAEMVSTTIITAAVSTALYKARVLPHETH